jgi:endonuclease YncB( thermonuclease family)
MAAIAGMSAGLLMAPTADAAERLAGPLRAEVVRVVDGDTLAVRAQVWLGQQVTTLVRLAGIDAPELAGGCAAERDMGGRARRALKRLAGRGVILHDLRFGKFAGRIVARVHAADGRDLAAALIAQGLARPFKGGRRGGWCPGPSDSGASGSGGSR